MNSSTRTDAPASPARAAHKRTGSQGASATPERGSARKLSLISSQRSLQRSPATPLMEASPRHPRKAAVLEEDLLDLGPAAAIVTSQGAPVQHPISPHSASIFSAKRPSVVVDGEASAGPSPSPSASPMSLNDNPRARLENAAAFPSSSSGTGMRLFDESADLHSTPEPNHPHLLRVLSAGNIHGSNRSTWPSGNGAVNVSAAVSGAAVSLSSGGRPLPITSGSITTPSVKERSHSALLPPDQASAVRSALHLPMPLHDAFISVTNSPQASPQGSPTNAGAASTATGERCTFDLSDINAFVHTPLPRGQQLCCTMYRDRSASRFYPTYILCVEEGPLLPLPMAPSGRSSISSGSNSLPSGSPRPASRTSFSATSGLSSTSTLSQLSSQHSSPHSRRSSRSSPTFGSFNSNGSGTSNIMAAGTEWLIPRRKMRVLLTATKQGSSKYHFRAAAPGEMPPVEAALMRAMASQAVASTPTLSPLLLGTALSAQDRQPPPAPTSAGVLLSPESSSIFEAALAAGNSNKSKLRSSHADCIGSLASNFIGNKYTFTSKGWRGGTTSGATSAAKSVSSVQQQPTMVEAVNGSGADQPEVLSRQLGAAPGATASVSSAPNSSSSSPFLLSSSGASLSVFSAPPAPFLPSFTTTGDADVEYEINIFSRAPRHMAVTLPPLLPCAPANDAASAESATQSKSSSRKSISSASAGAQPIILHSNLPRWHSERQCHTLNFGGRAPVPSMKNFQLVLAEQLPIPSSQPLQQAAPASSPSSSPKLGPLSSKPRSASPSNPQLPPMVPQQQLSPFPLGPPSLTASSSTDPSCVVLQMGKMGAHQFSVDARFPLTPLQAFAITLSAFDFKLER